MIVVLLSTVFGIGRARPAPGTVASLVALPFAWLMLWKLGPFALAAAALALYAIGVWSTGAYAGRVRRIDPQECVIDEVAGQWFACAATPLSPMGFILAFVAFRVLDISKLWPVSLGERLPGGWGIMTDDMIAAIMTAALIAGARWQGLV